MVNRSITHPRRFRAFALLLAAVAMVLVGCIRFELSITVNEDGSGEASILVALDEEAIEAFDEETGGDTENPFSNPTDEDFADLPDGAAFEDYNEDGFVGSRVTIPFAASDDVPAALETFFATTTAGDGLTGPDGLFETLELRREGDGWRLEALSVPLGLDDGGEDDSLFANAFVEALFSEASFEIKVELPGEIMEHNADRVVGSTMVWELGFTDSEPVQLMALTSANGGGSGSNLAVALIVVAFVIAVGAVAAWLFYSRTRAASGGV
jgi:hypothetical protein